MPPPPSRPSYPPHARESLRPDIVLSAPVDELLREVKATNLDELPGEVFRLFAEEFAARSRFLQDTFAGRANDVEALSRVIRTLTAVVSRRGLSGVYGLSRAHTGDWHARADDARARRLRLMGISPDDRGSNPPAPPADAPTSTGDR